MSETIKSWDTNSTIQHTQPRRAKKRSKTGCTMLIITIVYIVAALMYNYTFTFCTGAFVPDDTPTIETCYKYQNIINDGKQYVSEDYSIIKVFNRIQY